MSRRRREDGVVAMLAALVLLVGAAFFLASVLAGVAGGAERDAASDRAIAQAREALVAYAVDRAIDRAVGPGYLPCPDRDDDGWAEPTCGSLSGDSGQEQRLGRLPWKTLGLPDVRDGHGERLWYAVSTRHKGLLNCAASRACVDLTPASALGTITVRDPSGTILFDGTQSDPSRAEAAGAAAVVIAPGAPLERRSGAVSEQRRQCGPGDCDASGRCLRDDVPHCAAANFLDAAPDVGEDNAAFRDRSDAAGRPGNRDGFIAGPVHDTAGRTVVNDRLAAVGYADLMPRAMVRVALEAAMCLRAASAASGRYPLPDPACDEAAPFGRLPAFDAALEGCNLSAGTAQPSWWSTWGAHVLYAPSAAMATGGSGRCGVAGDCIQALDAQGRPLASGKHFALVITRRAGQCRSERLRCDAEACREVMVGDGADVARAFP
jgi:hypothetical protein